MTSDIQLEANAAAYTLLFEGPGDPTPATLRKIKTVLLADLEMPIEKITQILQCTSSPILSAENVDQLESAYRLLAEAGSKVLIITRDGTALTKDFFETANNSISIEITPPYELELNDLLEGEQRMSTPVFELQDDAALDLDKVLESVAAAYPETKGEEGARPAPGKNEYRLSIETESESATAQEISVAATDHCSSAEIAPTFDLILEDQENEIPSPSPRALVPENELSLDLEEPSAEATSPLPPITPSDDFLSLSLSDETEQTPQPMPPPFPTIVSQKLNLDHSVNEKKTSEEIGQPELQSDAGITPPIASHNPLQTSSPLLLFTEEINQAAPSEAVSPAPVLSSKVPTPAPTSEPKPLNEEQFLPEINLVPIRIRIKRKVPPAVEMTVLIILGSFILFIANWFYFNMPPAIEKEEEQRAVALAQSIDQKKKLLIKRNLEDLKKAQQHEALSAVLTRYSGNIVIAGYNINIELMLKNNTPSSASVTIPTTEPPALSNEQIANQYVPPPWIRRAESAPFEFIEVRDNQFIGSAFTKVYFDVAGISKRLMLHTYLEGSVDPEAQSLTLQLSLADENLLLESTPTWHLEAISGEVKLEVRDTITLHREQPTSSQNASLTSVNVVDDQ